MGKFDFEGGGGSQMGSKICMNTSCATATTHEWKKGWRLGSGGYADLCFRCGSAYESFIFCDTFHSEESGWRKCYFCSKRLHCGCIASESLVQLLDYGGVGCTGCAKSSQLNLVRRNEISHGFGGLTINTTNNVQVIGAENGNNVDGERLSQLCKIMEANEPDLFPQSQRGDTNVSFNQDRQGEFMHPIGEIGTSLSNAIKSSSGSSKFAKPDNSRSILDTRNMCDSLAQPSLSMTLGAPSGTLSRGLPFSSGIADGQEESKGPSFQQGQQSRPILPKPSRSNTALSDTNKSAVPHMRIARPPVEGRGKNHLLPRYWPRITDQELQQLSGDLNSNIVPLFEKVLSASDAGRIGRLVLPKACAEAYFPPINQSEGLPLKIQDVKGKEWSFQFRFWPNNNSRMYVLEGVTPCIQSMQLKAGDTVTFSRIDPSGRLVIGFRKATNNEDQLDSRTSAIPNCTSLKETSYNGGIESLHTVSGYSGIVGTMKGGMDPHINALSEHLSSADIDIGWHKNESHGDRNGDSSHQSILNAEKKRTRNIGSKSKRLLMHSEDVLELRLTWEEAQDLLRPPPTSKPSVVTIEDLEFEEYDEPPVFGKRTIFTSQPSGGQEQWAQCDDCSKWRKLPIDVLLPPKWTCTENIWDSSRCSCSVPEEMSSKELENLLRVGRDFKRRRNAESQKADQEHEPSGLDALASAAVLGDNLGESGEQSVGATTKHPRHRPGCTCIVCIQPPSGKGKHKPTCTCNVCMTVKRRFKTLMLRKKKRQSELEAEAAQKEQNDNLNESELNAMTGYPLHKHLSDNEGSHNRIQGDVAESSNSIDLNCHPQREEMQLEEPPISLMSLLQAANIENLMKQMTEQQASLGPCLLSPANGQSERHTPAENGFVASLGRVGDGRSDEALRAAQSLDRSSIS